MCEPDDYFHDMFRLVQSNSLAALPYGKGCNVIIALHTYIGSKIFVQMLKNCDRESPEIEKLAVDLCKFALYLNSQLDRNQIAWKRNILRLLFLSGLVLKRSRYPSGIFQCTITLNLLETARIRNQVEPELFSAFLDKADTCSSFHEILTIQVNQWSLWQVFVDTPGYCPNGTHCSSIIDIVDCSLSRLVHCALFKGQCLVS